ncbi:hypothetical protein TRIP_E230124 [uncultured Spirochaetota bacterium]|nr:hypothetical protein TRIP_E230124 [uncultured Spirochaetota bacterium]
MESPDYGQNHQCQYNGGDDAEESLTSLHGLRSILNGIPSRKRQPAIAWFSEHYVFSNIVVKFTMS